MNTPHQKAINNAISAYFMVGISWAFLFNKKDEHINTPFVRNHAKVAFLIHCLFIIIGVLFLFGNL